MKLKVGDPAPAFSLPDQSGKNHSLADFKGKKLLVFFYPKADTPGCTRQSCSVRDNHSDLSSLGVASIGASPDSSGAQKKFDDKFSLGFPLLADTQKTMAEAFGVWGERKKFGKVSMGINRSSFLVDEKGALAGVWYGVSPEDTVPNVLTLLKP